MLDTATPYCPVCLWPLTPYGSGWVCETETCFPLVHWTAVELDATASYRQGVIDDDPACCAIRAQVEALPSPEAAVSPTEDTD